MDATELLADLRRRGLVLVPDGDTLRYRPRNALTPELRAAVAAHKLELLALLADDEAEVLWRADAMRPQVPRIGPIPVLAARPEVSARPGACLSCGDPLPPGNRHRCRHCVRAAWRVLREVRLGPGGGWADDG
jgi:hypothetical protein